MVATTRADGGVRLRVWSPSINCIYIYKINKRQALLQTFSLWIYRPQEVGNLRLQSKGMDLHLFLHVLYRSIDIVQEGVCRLEQDGCTLWKVVGTDEIIAGGVYQAEGFQAQIICV